MAKTNKNENAGLAEVLEKVTSRVGPVTIQTEVRTPEGAMSVVSWRTVGTAWDTRMVQGPTLEIALKKLLLYEDDLEASKKLY